MIGYKPLLKLPSQVNGDTSAGATSTTTARPASCVTPFEYQSCTGLEEVPGASLARIPPRKGVDEALKEDFRHTDSTLNRNKMGTFLEQEKKMNLGYHAHSKQVIGWKVRCLDRPATIGALGRNGVFVHDCLYSVTMSVVCMVFSSVPHSGCDGYGRGNANASTLGAWCFRECWFSPGWIFSCFSHRGLVSRETLP